MGKGGKGSGAHVARKNKYAAHSVGASVKGKNKKKTGGTITLRNKANKAQKHQRLVEKQQNRKDDRLALLDQVKNTMKMSVGALSKKYGTLNIRRLTEILKGVADDSMWYKARVARKKAEAQARSTKVVRKHVKFHKHRKKNKAKSH